MRWGEVVKKKKKKILKSGDSFWEQSEKKVSKNPGGNVAPDQEAWSHANVLWGVNPVSPLQQLKGQTQTINITSP